MPGLEFVKKLLGGERDFKKIELEKNFNLGSNEAFQDLKKYLIEKSVVGDLRANPIILNDSQLLGLVAGKIDILYRGECNIRAERGEGINFDYIRAERVNLSGAVFNDAHITNANLKNAILIDTNFLNAYLIKSNFSGADVKKANFYNSVLINTDLREIINLEYALNLNDAIIRDTIVNRRERDIIDTITDRFQIKD